MRLYAAVVHKLCHARNTTQHSTQWKTQETKTNRKTSQASFLQRLAGNNPYRIRIAVRGPYDISQNIKTSQLHQTTCRGMSEENTFKSLPEYPSVAAANSSTWKSGAKSSSAKITFIILARLSASGRSIINLHVSTKSYQTRTGNMQQMRRGKHQTGTHKLDGPKPHIKRWPKTMRLESVFYISKRRRDNYKVKPKRKARD